jgi:hypothetical protein
MAAKCSQMEHESHFVDVRRLAAVDMHGVKGTSLRRRVIIAEFVLGAIGGIGIGLLLLFTADGAAGIIVGAWAVGIGVNYVPLGLHTLSLRRPVDLRTELAEADIRNELRRYTKSQLWVFVPFLFAGLALAQRD